jgi:exopolyphosphatase/guanosine-5'-triphosphate,3'-diphosphate pyrophosphatase
MTGTRRSADRRLALIDIGSNSIRLVVFDGRRRAPEVLFNEKVLCGLGRHIQTTGQLDPEGVDLALPNRRRFSRLVREMGVKRVSMLATAAVRDAVDGPAFVEAVEQETGEAVTLLSGQEEAHFSAEGVLAAIPDADGLMGDLGGGSLELVEIRDGRIGRGVTLPLGTFRLMGLGDDDPARAAKSARAILADVDWLDGLTGKTFYPVGGTWRNLARLFMALERYPLKIIHGYEVDARRMRRLSRRAMERDPKALKRLISISSLRLQAAPFGASLAQEIFRLTGAGRAVFSAYGLREGYLFSQLTKRDRQRDPLIATAREMGRREARFGDLGEALMQWTDPLLTDEDEDQRRLRQAACWLSDLVWREHVEHRPQQAFERVLQHPFIAIDHPGRLFVAYTLYCRYGGDPTDIEGRQALTLLPADRRHMAELLGEALRLAYRVSAAMPGLLSRTQLRCSPEGIHLDLPDDGSLPDGRAVTKSLQRLDSLFRNGLDVAGAA